MDAKIITTRIGIEMLIASTFDLLLWELGVGVADAGVGVADAPEESTVDNFVLVEANADDCDEMGKSELGASAEVSVEVTRNDEEAEPVGLAGVWTEVTGVAVKRAVAAVVNTLPATPLTRLQKSGSRVVY